MDAPSKLCVVCLCLSENLGILTTSLRKLGPRGHNNTPLSTLTPPGVALTLPISILSISAPCILLPRNTPSPVDFHALRYRLFEKAGFKQACLGKRTGIIIFTQAGAGEHMIPTRPVWTLAHTATAWAA
ncbi:hypothetical protein LY78DRAFT_20276 [Colletotrichum sublineola]|nr:hypothetical protein LY78DRAFT_20276 [Colletotrichum sublineola]